MCLVRLHLLSPFLALTRLTQLHFILIARLFAWRQGFAACYRVDSKMTRIVSQKNRRDHKSERASERARERERESCHRSDFSPLYLLRLPSTLPSLGSLLFPGSFSVKSRLVAHRKYSWPFPSSFDVTLDSVHRIPILRALSRSLPVHSICFVRVCEEI